MATSGRPVRKGLSKKVAYEQDPGRHAGKEPCCDLREELSRQRKRPVQRPQGRTVPGVLKEQQGADSGAHRCPSGWHRESKGEREEVRTGRGQGQGLVSHRQDLRFYSE